MKKSLSGIIFLLIIVFLYNSGLFEKISNFFIWLVTLNMTQSSVSTTGEIFVKIATLVISYALVGAIFTALKLFNSGIMKVAYFIVSTLVAFGLCYVVMIFETHLLLISIIAGIILLIIISGMVLIKVKEKNCNIDFDAI